MPGAHVASGLFPHHRVITMPKVICTRPNASLNINGVNFTPTEDGTGVLSDEISDDAAELFLSIPGYELAEQGEQKPVAPTKPTAPAKPPAAPAKAASGKKTASAPAPAPAAAPATPTAPAAATAAEGATAATGAGESNVGANTSTGSQDTTPGAGKGAVDSKEDPNVF